MTTRRIVEERDGGAPLDARIVASWSRYTRAEILEQAGAVGRVLATLGGRVIGTRDLSGRPIEERG